MVVLDTSIIIDHLRQKPGHPTRLLKVLSKVGKQNLAISPITIQELYRGESTRDEAKEELLLATIAPLRLLPYTYEVAQLAGEIGRDSQRSIELGDAVIAATAITHGAQLLTLNQKDFSHIPEIDLFHS
ncbi:MAG: type II toxin-antitoxin system VapC family toxin [Candidatus Andersenbacteria bacterium]